MSIDNSIVEGNFKIAKFSGYSYEYINSDVFKVGLHDLHNYNENWNLLMPVVEKIEALGATVYIRKSICEIAYIENNNAYCEVSEETPSKIKAVWLAIVNFINWYNSNQKQKS